MFNFLPVRRRRTIFVRVLWFLVVVSWTILQPYGMSKQLFKCREAEQSLNVSVCRCVYLSSHSVGKEEKRLRIPANMTLYVPPCWVCRKCAYSSAVPSQVLAPICSAEGTGDYTLLGGLVTIILDGTSLCVTSWDKVVEVKVIGRRITVLQLCEKFVLISCLGAANTWMATFDVDSKYFSRKNFLSANFLWRTMM